MSDTFVRKMPLPGHPSTPKFNGEPHLLSRFLKDVELLASDAELSDDMTIYWAIRYTSHKVSELWDALPESLDSDWEAFKAAVIALYPGADGDRKYSISDLDAFIDKSARASIKNRADLGEYYRQFTVITRYLLHNRRLSILERNRAYMQGLPMRFRSQVLDRLSILLPDNFPDDPYHLHDSHRAALFLVTGTPFTTSAAESQPPDTTEIPSDHPLADTIRSMQSQIALLTKSIAELTKLIAPTPSASVPSPPQHFTKVMYDRRCAFCSETGHFIRNCTLAVAYISQGRCARDANNRIVLPNGQPIPRNIIGNSFRERLDIWNSRYAPPAPAPPPFPTPTQQPCAAASQQLMFTVCDSNHAHTSDDITSTPLSDDESEKELVQVLESFIAQKKKKTTPQTVRLTPPRCAFETMPLCPNFQHEPPKSAKSTTLVPPMSTRETPVPNSCRALDYQTSYDYQNPALDARFTLSLTEIITIASDVQTRIAQLATSKSPPPDKFIPDTSAPPTVHSSYQSPGERAPALQPQNPWDNNPDIDQLLLTPW